MISSVDILNKEGRIFTKNNIDIYETELKSRTRPTMCFLVVAFFLMVVTLLKHLISDWPRKTMVCAHIFGQS